MRYCLSSRQPDSILKKADEIKIALRDYDAISYYIDEFSDKTIILEMDKNLPKGFDWNVIQAYSEKMNGNFYCALRDLTQVNECKSRDIKFYYKYQINTLFELEGLKQIGVSYILLGASLMFDLKSASSYGIPLRAVPNLAYEPYIKRENGIIGGWVRPEDVNKYGQYIDVFEFYAPQQLDKEATLFKIYSENKAWPGNLNLIIDQLNYDVNNQMISDEENFATRRMNCQQKCLRNYPCSYCTTQFKFELMIREYKQLREKFDFIIKK